LPKIRRRESKREMTRSGDESYEEKKLLLLLGKYENISSTMENSLKKKNSFVEPKPKIFMSQLRNF
jgi:hypothetical protein